MFLEFFFLPSGVASVLTVQHTVALTLSLLRQEDGIGGTCSTRKEVQHAYTILVGRYARLVSRRARVYHG